MLPPFPHRLSRCLALLLVLILIFTAASGCTTVSKSAESPEFCIGIVGALDEETINLIAELKDVNVTETAACTFIHGNYNDVDYVIGTSNMGKVYAALTTQQMIDYYHPDCIINIGVGGALSESLNVGDVVIPSQVFQHDYDVSPLGVEPCHIYETDMMYLPTNTSLAAILKTCGNELDISIVDGIDATGDIFVNDLAEKNRLNQEYNATVCDMEGAAVVLVSSENNIPSAVCRSISDTLSGNENEYYENLANEGARLSQLMLKLNEKKEELIAALK